jgi:L-threonylcarbamoyladenylate synthase
VIDAADARRLEECVAAGGVAVFPADTVSGLCCDAENPRAVRRCYELKGRAAEQPAAIMFFALPAALSALPEIGARERVALRALLPGPVTLLLANRTHRYPLAGGVRERAPDELRQEGGGLTGGEMGEGGRGGKAPATLGLRVPAWSPSLAALGTVGVPVLQSSANLSGEPDARRLLDVPASIRNGADLVLDGGELPGIPSTVVDLREYEQRGEWSIVREGPLTRAALERALA